MITVILLNGLDEEIERVYSNGNEKYLFGLNSDIYPMLSQLDDNSYDVFSGDNARRVYKELLILTKNINCIECQKHLNELCRLAKIATNDKGKILMFTPF